MAMDKWLGFLRLDLSAIFQTLVIAGILAMCTMQIQTREDIAVMKVQMTNLADAKGVSRLQVSAQNLQARISRLEERVDDLKDGS